MNERQIDCEDLAFAVDQLRREGFRLHLIYPADDPHTAVLNSSAETVRVTTKPSAPAPCITLPRFEPEFVVTRGGMAGQGRAGMLYRDLIPGRLGGRYIASEILIKEGGTVADWVHFHHIALQILYVREGWVRVVYEDQGEPFVMCEGDLVLQPPEIRHRVLESSAPFQVIEISAPASHATFADNDCELPNGINPMRVFQGQHFLHHRAKGACWIASIRGGERQETEVAQASSSLAEAQTVRAGGSERIDFPAHDGELVFGFVLGGSAVLEFGGHHKIDCLDAFVLPPGEPWGLSELSPDLRLLHVTTAKLD